VRVRFVVCATFWVLDFPAATVTGEVAFGLQIAVGRCAMTEQQNKTPASSAKKSRFVLLLVLACLSLLVGGSGTAWFLLARTKKPPVAVNPQDSEYTVHLASFIVNLADPEDSHFLRITMDLGLAHAPKAQPGEKEGDGDAGFPTARTRDTILSVLTSCHADDLLTPEGKSQLKHNLLAALQKSVPEIEARDVYFTEFLVQR
jgi:flagellar protein FliL